MIETYYPNLTNQTVVAASQARPVALLPIGTVESNGPHQLLGCDYILAEELAIAAAADARAIRLPTLHYGVSELHAGLPGTISLTEELFSSLVETILRGAAANGFTRIIALNCHRHNHQPLELLARRLRREGIADLAVIDPLEVARDLQGGLFANDTKAAVGHGGEPLMSLICHLRPDLVDLGAIGTPDLNAFGGLKALSSTRFVFNGSKVGLFPLAEEINASGAWADVSNSSAERGALAFGAIRSFLVDFCGHFAEAEFEGVPL